MANSGNVPVMPLSPIAEFFLQPLFELLLQIAGYFTARIVVPTATFGYVTVEPQNGKSVKPGRGRLQRRAGGGWLMEAELAALFGLLFWFAIGGVVLLARLL
jgi:hypothetical protein